MSYYKYHMMQFFGGFGGSRLFGAGPFFDADGGGSSGGGDGDSTGTEGESKQDDPAADHNEEGDSGTKEGSDEKSEDEKTKDEDKSGKDEKSSEGEGFKATEIALPEGSEYDEALGGKFEGIVNKFGLGKEQAQELADLYFETLGDVVVKTDESIKAAEAAKEKARSEAAEKAFADEEATWLEEAKADPEIGGQKWEKTQVHVQNGVRALKAEKCVEYLQSIGCMNHPEIIRTFAKIGEMTGEDRLSGGGGGTQKPQTMKDHAHAIFGKND